MCPILQKAVMHPVLLNSLQAAPPQDASSGTLNVFFLVQVFTIPIYVAFKNLLYISMLR